MAHHFKGVDCDAAELGLDAPLVPVLSIRDGPRRLYIDEGSRQNL